MGGGIIFLPALVFLLPGNYAGNINSTLIPIATSLFAGTIATFSSSVKHYITGNVCFREALIISAASITGAFIVPKLAVKINPDILKYIISTLLLLAALNMMFRTDEDLRPVLKLSKRYLLPAGFITGIFSALTGLGGGIIIVPLLMYIFGMEAKKAIGTSVLVVAFTMLASSVSYATVSTGTLMNGYIGYINLHAGLLLGAGAVAGAIIGVNLNLRINTSRVKKLFSIFIIIVIIKLLLS